MVTCLLLALGALLWPGRRRGVAGTVGGAARGGQLARAPTVGAPRPKPVLLATVGACMLALPFGVAGLPGLLATGAVLATGSMLVRRAMADRRRRAALIEILAALRMLGRELRTGAEPALAAVNARAAAGGEGAAVLGALAQLARSDDRHDSPDAAAVSSISVSGVSPVSGLAVSAGAVPDGPDDDPRVQAQARLRSGWLLTRRHGLAFTPLIDALATDLAEQLAADEERAGQVAGPRMSGYVMAVLPLMGLALGVGMGADPVRVLVASPVGNILMLIGVTLTCAGLLWSARIVRR